MSRKGHRMRSAALTASLLLFAPAVGGATESGEALPAGDIPACGSLVAPLLGNQMHVASDDALEAGLAVFVGDGLGVALAATGAAMERGCRAEEAPRWPLWWSGFAPAVASAALLDVVAPDDPEAVLAVGTAASIAWFGVVAFTDLGYGRPASQAAPAAVAGPTAIRLREGWAPGIAVSGRF
jgi:hypothetical protein